MNHKTFCEKHNFQCDHKQHDKVLHCIPKAFMLVRSTMPNVTEALYLPSLKINGQNFIRRCLSNRLI